MTMPAKRAIAVGGGFIGLEMTENLKHLGLDVTLLQRGPQVMDPLDPEMALYVKRYMERDGINDCVVQGQQDAVNPEKTGTKAAAHYRVMLEAGQTAVIRLWLSRTTDQPFDHCQVS
jgi:pyruvate/2-oxoglutarate dehydrogenase complex dihydrolipoamide dehydrogenase (E3) component